MVTIINLFMLPRLLHARELNLNLLCPDRFLAKLKVRPSFLGLCWHPPIFLCLGKKKSHLNKHTFVISIMGNIFHFFYEINFLVWAQQMNPIDFRVSPMTSSMVKLYLFNRLCELKSSGMLLKYVSSWAPPQILTNTQINFLYIK